MHKAKYMLTGVATASLFVAAAMNSSALDVDVSGYLDMSVLSTDTDGMPSDDSAGIDTLELCFKTEVADGVGVEAHVAGGSDEDFDLEQAHMTYAVNDNVSLIAGKYLSALGWEAFHAPDLFQYSTSATLVYPGMMNGAGAKYAGEGFEVYGSALAGVWDSTDTDTEDMGFEGNIRLTAIQNLTVFVGFATEEVGAVEATAEMPAMGEYDPTLVNVWASYKVGDNITLAAEFNDVSDWGGSDNDGEGWLAMINVGLTETIALTLRTSALDVEDAAGASVTDVEKWTIAPSLAVTENLSLIAEYSSSKDNVSGADTDQVALEAIVTF